MTKECSQSSNIPVEQLDEQTCEQARLNRDARYDGRVFIGVTSTGVYCRPICPAPHAKRVHVRFFPSAAAATQAGFRPCLRCRPEVAPGTPAWNGTSATVSRGLRLIAEGALDEGNVEMLATRLGMSARHLSRLFLRHLGALPTTVAQTRRLHFAKQLISDSSLSMGQVAMASGFRSIRRFNEVFHICYGRPPSELRRQGPDSRAPDEYVFHLAYRPPYDWNSLLTYLAISLTPGVESITKGIYRRSITIRNHHGILEVRPMTGTHMLRVHIRFPQPECLLQIVTRVRAMFDLAADPEIICQHLDRDRLLSPLLRRHPGLRVPGTWDSFELIVHAILSQQFPLHEAGALAGQLAECFGEPVASSDTQELFRTFPQTKTFASARLSCLPQSSARIIRTAAQALTVSGADTSLDQLLARLENIKDIEESTIQYIAMRALNDPDAFPVGHPVLQPVISVGPLREAVLRRSETWKPWRAYAAMYLLCAAGVGQESPNQIRTHYQVDSSASSRLG
ncbi:MAG: AlkA N-terminal domain-containing protein [Gammaproteobacteria bacterium]